MTQIYKDMGVKTFEKNCLLFMVVLRIVAAQLPGVRPFIVGQLLSVITVMIPFFFYTLSSRKSQRKRKTSNMYLPHVDGSDKR